jgi:hypothetical protein
MRHASGQHVSGPSVFGRSDELQDNLRKDQPSQPALSQRCACHKRRGPRLGLFSLEVAGWRLKELKYASRKPDELARGCRRPHWSTIGACGWGSHQRRTIRTLLPDSNLGGLHHSSSIPRSRTTEPAKAVLLDWLLSGHVQKYFHASRGAAEAAESEAFG